MSKKSQTTPANHTRTAQQLADLATLLGLMQSASKLSQELDVLANQVGGSLEKIAERFGVPFGEVHQTFVEQRVAGTRERKIKKPRRAAPQR
ncbi:MULTISPECIES: hypothetical protein [Bradyrhizobium]|uniref:hypothetical protein n=1 Tax=Bradyrhizobium TaxID=374 RepID=UPI0004817A53|nr:MULTISPECIES: hypothetical protein [Bradyrhizobium]QOG22243.1 hypothetical protein FOM02_38095 [Bradyrhizobium sp. SEMIA]UFW50014.1 hypothetical protein BaraCB756_02700 [Bradyrhizobium arachidis]